MDLSGTATLGAAGMHVDTTALTTALAIAHSEPENIRMNAEMDMLEEPLLKWYRTIRFAPQPTFERRNGQIRLVARGSPLETYAPFMAVRLDGCDLIAACALCPEKGRVERRLTQQKSKDDTTRKLQIQNIKEHLTLAHNFILTFSDAAEAAEKEAAKNTTAVQISATAVVAPPTSRTALSAADRRAADARFVRMVLLCGGVTVSFALAESAGWREWCAAEGVPIVPKRSAQRTFTAQYEKYRNDVLQMIQRLRTPATICCGPEGVPVAGQTVYEIVPPLADSTDGWSRHGLHFITHRVSGGIALAREPGAGSRLRLRPAGCLIAVSTFVPLMFNPDAHGERRLECLPGLHILPFFY